MKKPNVIIIVTDDQGYGDLSCMGTTDFRTPYFDRLAGEGVRMTDFYATSPVCSPSRASLLTGQYPIHAGVRSILSGGRKTSGLSDNVPTVSSLLKANGYRTALFGKWHLGHTEDSLPSAHGFDEWFGFLAGCIDYYSHIYYWEMNSGGPLNTQTHDLWHNGNEMWRNGEYMTDMITDQAVNYIGENAGREEPFLMYVAYNAPHYPMHAPQKYIDRFKNLPWDRQIMAAMLSAVDDGIGAIVAELERHDIYENTILFFMSDNGPSREARNWLDGRPDHYYGGTSGGLKGHKGSLFEGGIRVPSIITWKGHIPGGQIVDTPLSAIDVLPTLLEAAQIVPSHTLDGISFLSHLNNDEPFPERTLYWEFMNQKALRHGKWKLVTDGQLVEDEPPAEEIFLSDLHADKGETTNLAHVEADQCSELSRSLQEWYTEADQFWNSHWSNRMNAPILFPD